MLILAIVLGGTPGGSSSRSTKHNGGAGGAFEGASFPAGVHAPNFTLSDQHGRSVSLSAYRGRVVALAFLPTGVPTGALQGKPFGVSPGCRTCVLVAQQVRGALDELESHPPAKPGVQAIFVSTNPGAQRVRVGHFLRETSLSNRVEYLTGTAAELQPVWHAYHVLTASAGKAAAEAAITVLLIDPQGFERVGFGVEQITPESLTHDIRLLQAR